MVRGRSFAVVKGPTEGGVAILNLSGGSFQVQGHVLESAIPHIRGCLDLKSRFKHWIEHLDLNSHCAMKELAEDKGVLLLVLPMNYNDKLRSEVFHVLRSWLTEMHVPCPEHSNLPMKVIEISALVREPV